MLNHILQQVQDFERDHTLRPNVVFINQDQYSALREYYPELFDDDPAIILGFKMIVLPNEVLAFPEVVWLPPQIPGYENIFADVGLASQPIMQSMTTEIAAIH